MAEGSWTADVGVRSGRCFESDHTDGVQDGKAHR